MRQSAALACRSPPRLSRWRVVLSEDACCGLTPHSAAKEASLRSRSGLSPAAMSRAAAVSEPTPRVGQQHGVWRVTASVSRCSRSWTSSLNARMRWASKVQGVDRRAGDILRCAGFQLRTVTDEHGGAQARQRLT
jgi:hypothetical protein